MWNKIQKLWREWKPTDVEAAIWRGNLNKYDQGLVSKAIDLHYEKAGKWRRPDLEKLKQLIGEVAQQTKDPAKTEFFYIAFICTEDGDKPAGYYEQFCWVAKWDSVAMAYQVPTQEHLAKRCQDYQNRFKGRWVSMIDKHYPDIRRKAQQFKRSTV